MMCNCLIQEKCIKVYGILKNILKYCMKNGYKFYFEMKRSLLNGMLYYGQTEDDSNRSI